LPHPLDCHKASGVSYVRTHRGSAPNTIGWLPPQATPSRRLNMSKTQETPTMSAPVEIIPAKPGAPQAKLADVNVTITPENVHLFLGLKIAGFVLWDNGSEGTGVSVPRREFSSNGDTRYFNVLRSSNGDSTALDPLKHYILGVYWQQPAHV
jgi:hypothetical protein